MWPNKEHRTPACNTINQASRFKFLRWETVFPSKNIDAINKIKKCDEFVYKTVSNSKDEILKIVNSGIY